MKLRPGGDPVALRVDPLDQPVLAAGGPYRAVGEGQQRRRDRQRDSAPHAAAAGIHADDLGPARDPDRTGARGDPGRVRRAFAVAVHGPPRRDLPHAGVDPHEPRPALLGHVERSAGQRHAPGTNGRRTPPSALRRATSTSTRRCAPPSSAQAERLPKTRSCGGSGRAIRSTTRFRPGSTRDIPGPPDGQPLFRRVRVVRRSAHERDEGRRGRGNRRGGDRNASLAHRAGQGGRPRARRAPRRSARRRCRSAGPAPSRWPCAITSSSRPGMPAAGRSAEAAARSGAHRRPPARSPGRTAGTGQALVQDAAKGVHVRASVDLLALDLLRRDVRDRPTKACSPVRLLTDEACLARPKSPR